MNFINVDDFVLVYEGLFPKELFLIFFCSIIITILILRNFDKISSILLYSATLLLLTAFFSLNGPDKGSYASIYTALDDFGSVFEYYNTLDAPLYYLLMALFKNLELPYDAFFIVQNILISAALIFIASRNRCGIYVSLWILMGHFLIPFSVRAHLLLPMLIIFYLSSNYFSRIITSALGVGTHFLSALPLFTAISAGNIRARQWLYISLLFVPILFITTDIIIGKLYEYIYNSEIYAGESSGGRILIEFFEFLIFFKLIKVRMPLHIFLIFLPVFNSVLAIYFPMFGRLGFVFDCIIVYFFLMGYFRNQASFYMLIFIPTFLLFIKNYLMIDYYVI